jgi:hypothetical protein
MHGEIPTSIVVEAVLIMAWKFLLLLAPFITVAMLWWLANRADRIMHYLFPNLEWEHSLGWLNVRAERQAKTALRWIGYGIYALLGAALLAIVTSVKGLEETQNLVDPNSIGYVLLWLGTIFVCLGAWVLYLGLWLIPQIRAKREEAGLKEFRVEMAELEAEKERLRKFNSSSRVKSPLQKPRQDAVPAKATPYDMFTPDRTRGRQ